jgi:hypothetical protein
MHTIALLAALAWNISDGVAPAGELNQSLLLQVADQHVSKRASKPRGVYVRRRSYSISRGM